MVDLDVAWLRLYQVCDLLRVDDLPSWSRSRSELLKLPRRLTIQAKRGSQFLGEE